MTIKATYQSIADRFARCVSDGAVTTDRYLRGDLPDERRGLTLLARPDAQTINNIETTIEQLQSTLGTQYVQPAEDLHVTVLSVIPGSADYAHQRQWLEPCTEAVDEAVAGLDSALSIRFCGLIGSPDGVLVKGYPEGEALAELRARLLSALEDRQLERHFVRRYPMVAAHMTAVRFVREPNDLQALQVALGELTTTTLGQTAVRALELVENDWYMRRGALRNVRTYGLPG